MTQVRRELSSALRDITILVGGSAMSCFVAQTVEAALQQYTASVQGMAPGHTAWTQLECCLYAANVVLGQCGTGKTAGPAETAAVQKLLEVATACAMYHQGRHGVCMQLVLDLDLSCPSCSCATYNRRTF